MQQGIFSETPCFLILFLNKLYEAIIKRNCKIVWVYPNSQPLPPWATVLFYKE